MTMQDAAASIGSVQSQLDATNSILEQRQSQKKELTAEIAALEKKLADSQAARNIFTAALESLGKQGDIIDGDLLASVDNLVDGIDLRSINHSGRDLTISGQSPDRGRGYRICPKPE